MFKRLTNQRARLFQSHFNSSKNCLTFKIKIWTSFQKQGNSTYYTLVIQSVSRWFYLFNLEGCGGGAVYLAGMQTSWFVMNADSLCGRQTKVASSAAPHPLQSAVLVLHSCDIISCLFVDQSLIQSRSCEQLGLITVHSSKPYR